MGKPGFWWRSIASALLLTLLLLMLLLWLRSPIQAVSWALAPNPGLTGPFARNEQLADIEILLADVGEGPEAVIADGQGRLYTGLQDGRIIRFTPDGEYQNFVNTGGRPLGMAFDAQGQLIVADAFMGLLAISPTGEITVLVDSVEGKKMLFVDDLDIAADGTIWFSDASQRYDQHNFMYDFLEARPTGRLLSYHPQSGETRVHMDELFFANGVALGPDDDFVLINETGTGRIHRLWLAGDRQGQRDIFFDGLPGGPDNLTFNGVDTFWVALPLLRQGPLEKLADKPLIRQFLAGLPLEWLLPISSHGFVVGLNTGGEVVANLQTNQGGYHNITSVVEIDGRLYMGSIAMRSVAVLTLQ